MDESEINEDYLLGDDSDKDETYQPGDELDVRKLKRKLPFQQDSDKDSSGESTDETMNMANHPDLPEAATPSAKRLQKSKSRKKLRRPELWQKNKAHTLRNLGQTYTDRKGHVHAAKTLQEYTHQCRFECNTNILEPKRQDIFDDYWKLGNFDLQTAFIHSAISLQEPQRRKDLHVKKRNLSVFYTLNDFRVCKEFFRLTLGVSNKRLDNVVAKKKLSLHIAPKDKRGKKEPSNKIPQEQIDLVKEHINSIPKYVSHYTRARNPTQKYMHSNLNIKKLISLYKEFCSEKNVEPVSDSFYRHIFNTHFNIKFKKPHSDTCTTCDKLDNFIKFNNNNGDYTISKEKHIRKAEAAKTAKSDAVDRFKNDETTSVICFDLEKTLPTPNLTCSRVFYSRQLWTYNFCVHDLKTNKSTMFMWHEGQGGRGCTEIASCLLKYIENLSPSVKHLVAFSDNCGGQNKSALIIRFWAYIVANTKIESVEHQFFVPGHSFMECDQDFAVIENAKKTYEAQIFVPEHWRKVVSKASRNFMVVEMNKFIDSLEEPFENLLVSKVPGIQKMTCFRLEKEDPFTLKYKTCYNKSVPFQIKSLKDTGCPKKGRPKKGGPVKKKSASANVPSTLKFLDLKKVEKINPIKPAKFKDLQGLLDFIPPVHHTFFNELPVSSNKKTTTADMIEHADENDEEVEGNNMLFTDDDDDDDND